MDIAWYVKASKFKIYQMHLANDVDEEGRGISAPCLAIMIQMG